MVVKVMELLGVWKRWGVQEVQEEEEVRSREGAGCEGRS